MSAKMPTLKEMWSLKGVIARCSILGTVIGILPGAGAYHRFVPLLLGRAEDLQAP